MAPLNISDSELFIHLISLEMKDYDVILNMDFQSKYVSINCHRHSTVFQLDGEEAFEFLGEHKKKKKILLMTMEARKLICSGCEAYLAHVVEKRSENKVQLSDVPIVKDFRCLHRIVTSTTIGLGD